jgi:hypothetical protein
VGWLWSVRDTSERAEEQGKHVQESERLERLIAK